MMEHGCCPVAPKLSVILMVKFRVCDPPDGIRFPESSPVGLSVRGANEPLTRFQLYPVPLPPLPINCEE